MDNNQVCNSKVEVPTGMMLNDKDYLDSLLSTLKQFVKNYAVILTEKLIFLQFSLLLYGCDKDNSYSFPSSVIAYEPLL